MGWSKSPLSLHHLLSPHPSPSPAFVVWFFAYSYFPTLFTTQCLDLPMLHILAEGLCAGCHPGPSLPRDSASCSRTRRCSSTATSARGFRKGLMDSPERIPGVSSLFDTFPYQWPSNWANTNFKTALINVFMTEKYWGRKAKTTL